MKTYFLICEDNGDHPRIVQMSNIQKVIEASEQMVNFLYPGFCWGGYHRFSKKGEAVDALMLLAKELAEAVQDCKT